MTLLMSVLPDPVPLLVIVPVLLRLVVLTVMPLEILLLFLKIKLPVPLAPPEIVNSEVPLALLFVIVVPFALGVMAPLMVIAALGLFSIISVTLDPIPPLMVTT